MLDQAVVFLLAGHETTSTALTFALWELARRPELQDAVREEARAALPTDPTADAGEVAMADVAGAHRPRATYLPFGGGPRSCIGTCRSAWASR